MDRRGVGLLRDLPAAGWRGRSGNASGQVVAFKKYDESMSGKLQHEVKKCQRPGFIGKIRKLNAEKRHSRQGVK